jgi:HEAT repeat protein
VNVPIPVVGVLLVMAGFCGSGDAVASAVPAGAASPGATGPALDVLVASLKSPDAKARAGAVDALLKGAAGNPAVPGAVARLLGDADTGVRQSAASLLAELARQGAQSPQAVDPLLAALNDPDLHVRGLSAMALGFMREPRAVDALVALTRDKELQVRADALYALASLGTDRAVDAVIAALKDADWRVRASAASNLGRAPQARTVVPVLALLKDVRPEVRQEAARALGEIGDAKATGPLTEAARDPDAKVREAAQWALDRILQIGGATDEDRAVGKRLAMPMPEIDFSDLALADVLRFFGDVTGVNMHVRWRPMEAAGAARDTKVNLHLSGVTAGAAIRLVLGQAGKKQPLAYRIEDGIVIVSTGADLGKTAPGPPPTALRPAGTPADKEAWQRLQRQIPAQFENVPFQDVVEYLGAAAGTKVRMDKRALEEVGINPATPVTLALKGVPACVVLRLVVGDVGGGKLAFDVHEGVVVVSTPAGLARAGPLPPPAGKSSAPKAPAKTR